MHIQNATLAGGVAIGAVADMLVYPVGAILIGAAGGCISVIGYNKITPFLEEKAKIHDTCDINNLHGMPSLISGISACIVAAWASESAYGVDLSSVYPKRPDRSAQVQSQMQVAFLFITLCIAITAGAITGWIIKHQFFDPMHDGHLFLDMESWEVPHMETPYYFDQRGEVGRKAIQASESEGAGKAQHSSDSSVAAHSQRGKPADGPKGDAFFEIVDRLDLIMSELALSRIEKTKTR